MTKKEKLCNKALLIKYFGTKHPWGKVAIKNIPVIPEKKIPITERQLEAIRNIVITDILHQKRRAKASIALNKVTRKQKIQALKAQYSKVKSNFSLHFGDDDLIELVNDALEVLGFR